MLYLQEFLMYLELVLHPTESNLSWMKVEEGVGNNLPFLIVFKIQNCCIYYLELSNLL